MRPVFKPSDRQEVVTIHGASEFELNVIGRLNAMISGITSGRGRRFWGGDPGSLGTRFGGMIKSPQNFQHNTVLQSPGSTRGLKANPNKGLPDSQAPSGGTNQLLDLLLQRPIQ